MQLTDEQQQIVETDAKRALVMAGPGTGKTTVLTHRIAHLLSTGVPSSQMLCVTFTRRAAAQMRERLTELLGDDADNLLRYLNLGTIHAVALSLFRADCDKLGYVADSLVVLDAQEADLILEEAARGAGYVSSDGTWSQIGSFAKLKQFVEAQYHGTPEPRMNGADRHAYDVAFRHYATMLRELNCLDYGQILLQLFALMTQFPAVRAKWLERIRYVLVDEVQDSDENDWKFYRLFPNAHFFAIGDYQQSIYGWRGAVTMRAVEGCRLYTVRQSHRFGQALAEKSFACLSRMGTPVPLEQAAHLTYSDAIYPTVGTNASATIDTFTGNSRVIGRRIQFLHDNGFAYEDVAVLARDRRSCKRIRDVCSQYQLPHHCVGDLFEGGSEKLFRDTYAAMRLLVNKRDDIAFRWLSSEWLGMDAEGMRTLAHEAGLRTDGLLGAWREYVTKEGEWMPPNPLAGLLWGGHNGWSDAYELAQHIERAMGAMPANANAAVSVHPIWKKVEGLTPAEALVWYGTHDSQDDLDERGVTISTVHAAKGLEFRAVIVVNLNEKDFPSSASIRNETVQEERRVFYVAITRAREYLGLHWREPMHQRPGSERPKSRFLVEIGE